MKSILLLIFSISCVIQIGLCDQPDAAAAAGSFKALMTGYQEISPVYTKGTGEITVASDIDTSKLTITLNYANITAAPIAVRLFWGSAAVTGAPVLNICGSPTSNVCPASGASATFTFAPGLIQGVPGTGFPAGNLSALVDAMQNGVIYANVFTQQFPNGELRGQLGRGFGGGPKPNPGKGRGPEKP